MPAPRRGPALIAPIYLCACAGSICAMKRNTHVIVPASCFRLLTGQDKLSCYQVG